MYDIVIGRSESDKKLYGLRGAVLVGKHFVKMGATSSLANKVYMDVTRSHIVFVCGKRGGGKSYTMGVIAEGMANLEKDIAQNLSIIMLDTMGIYWTMKYPNKKDKKLLDDWGLDVKIYTPTGFYNDYKKKGIPTDFPFSVQPSELTGSDWVMTFGLDSSDSVAVLIERIIYQLKEEAKPFDLEMIMKRVMNDPDAEKVTKLSAKNYFQECLAWGLFDKEGTPLKDLAKGGQVSVLDVSCYATTSGGWKVKNLVIGLVAQKLFLQRMLARKDEEFLQLKAEMNYYSEEGFKKQDFPLVWLVIDEAHEFLPVKGKTLATDPLVTILREGRQPGISLILATQQPGKIHTDVMTQSDTVIAHRITAKPDVEALGMLMQSYMREGMVTALDNLPRVKGAGIVFDDTNERMYPMRVRPRFTWHGGEAPRAIHEKKEEDLLF
ncbi:hypothetical protein CMO92_04625 [Candidatus Woesearchaeota archaeon]|nr:hypothetical protein [Candidatus Woesearchaeota archaeon]